MVVEGKLRNAVTLMDERWALGPNYGMVGSVKISTSVRDMWT